MEKLRRRGPRSRDEHEDEERPEVGGDGEARADGPSGGADDGLRSERVLRFEVPGFEVLERMVGDPLPVGLENGPVRLDFFRDVYFDTPGGDMEHKSATVRLRMRRDGGRSLMVEVFDREVGHGIVIRGRSEADVPESEPEQVFSGPSEPARLLRALIDPSRLEVAFEIETRRWLRRTRFSPVVPGLRALDGDDWDAQLAYDAITVRRGERTGDLQELEVRLPEGEGPGVQGLVDVLGREYGLRLTLSDTAGRAREVLEGLEMTRLEEDVRRARQVAVIGYRNGNVALRRIDGGLRIPTRQGAGIETCRRALRDFFGTTRGRVRVLGTTPGVGARPALEVWLAEAVQEHPEQGEPKNRVWLPLETVLGMVGSRGLREPATLAALHVLARAGLAGAGSLEGDARFGSGRTGPGDGPAELSGGKRRRQPEALELAMPGEEGADEALVSGGPVPPEQLLNMELSRLAFDERILVMAEDARTPLLERVRFLSMFGERLDDVFMTRVAKFKDQLLAGSSRPTLDGLSPVEQLDAVGVRARHVCARAYRLLCRDLLGALAEEGIELLRWSDLEDEEREWLRNHYYTQVEAVLTPFVSDSSHPFPHLESLRPAVAAVVRLPESRVEHFAAIELPEELPRFVSLPGGQRFVPLEEVVAASLPHVYAGLEVVEAHPFRVTRAGRIKIHEDEVAGDVLPAVEEKVRGRPYRPVVRLEVEEGMPSGMRDFLLRELRYEFEDTLILLDEEDVYPVRWLVGLPDLREIVTAGSDARELVFPPMERARPLPVDRSIFELMREGERLVHFPHDDFEATVGRFLSEAADDPDVLAIKVTIYRTGPDSGIVEAMARARERGKDAVAMVELKASFDEARNIEFARSLERAGIHVVFSPPRFKVHAKAALVVRREPEGLRRYAYVGTGNLNAATAASYVDLGLLTADPALAEEVNAVFNVLTGYSAGTDGEHALVSPFNMRRRFLELVNREVEHARAGRPARIRIQVNGMTDPVLIGALYRASREGVGVELTVREICSLRPGVEGLSENVRVRSLLGRFLQHARIFGFENGGETEYYMGSADWRPRNLDERVELVVPVRRPEHRTHLDRILTRTFHDPDAWELTASGTFVRGEEAVGGRSRRA